MSRGSTRLVPILFLGILLSGACAERPEITAERGKELYLAYGCAACHGAEGDGNGPAAGLAKIAPRNLLDLGSYVQGTSLEDITRSIEHGMKATGMPAYAELPREERLAMATWILDAAREKK
jgi:mono/diheme cytochrome c family protein